MHKYSICRHAESRDRQADLLKWASNELLFHTVVALADGDVDAMLQVLEGVQG